MREVEGRRCCWKVELEGWQDGTTETGPNLAGAPLAPTPRIHWPKSLWQNWLQSFWITTARSSLWPLLSASYDKS